MSINKRRIVNPKEAIVATLQGDVCNLSADFVNKPTINGAHWQLLTTGTRVSDNEKKKLTENNPKNFPPCAALLTSSIRR